MRGENKAFATIDDALLALDAELLETQTKIRLRWRGDLIDLTTEHNNQDIMHRMSEALLERETLDANEIRLIIEGKELPPVKSALAAADSGPDDTQKVLKPEGGRKTGFNEGQAAQA